MNKCDKIKVIIQNKILENQEIHDNCIKLGMTGNSVITYAILDVLLEIENEIEELEKK